MITILASGPGLHHNFLRFTFKILDAVKKEVSLHISKLDVFQEGYIYAELEKEYRTTLMPLINNFFESTRDINDYVKKFPNCYKNSNPNLP